MRAVTVSEKEAMSLSKRAERGIREGLRGGKGKEKCDYIIVSKLE